MSEIANEKVLDELNKKVKFWYDWANICIWLYWFVGVLGVAMSALAGSGISNMKYSKEFAVTATICFSIIGFVNPQKRAARFLTAYRLLEPAIRRYKYHDLQLNDLLDTHEKAESILNEGEFDGGTIPKQPNPS